MRSFQQCLTRALVRGSAVYGLSCEAQEVTAVVIAMFSRLGSWRVRPRVGLAAPYSQAQLFRPVSRPACSRQRCNMLCM
jgi:hypothetical protein